LIEDSSERSGNIGTMKTNIDTLPDWTIQLDEVSAGVYRLIAKHPLGSSIDLTGTDPEELLKQAKTSAEAMEKDLRTRRHKT
jgi:hypothetical protein